MGARRSTWSSCGLAIVVVCGTTACRHAPMESAEPVAFPDGEVVVRVRDARSGAPLEVCDLVGMRTGRTISAVTPSAPNVAADGVHRYRVRPMAGRLKLGAPGYSETWTPDVRVASGETTSVAVALEPLGRLIVTVVDGDGEPLKEGTLVVWGREFEQAISVKNGVADVQIDAGERVVSVDPDQMPGFEPFELPVVIRPGEPTTARIPVARR
ncbi:MAG: hypothetical protein U1E39_15785 [Planctomycetota bacterium]